MTGQRKAFKLYFQPSPLWEILTILNLRRAASSVWACAESEFRPCWMKMCSIDSHYTTVVQLKRESVEKIKDTNFFMINEKGKEKSYSYHKNEK